MIENLLGHGLGVFLSYVFNPLGGLMVIALGLSGVGVLMNRAGRVIRMVFTAVSIVFAVWVMVGVLESMGVPVIAWLTVSVQFLAQFVREVFANALVV